MGGAEIKCFAEFIVSIFLGLSIMLVVCNDTDCVVCRGGNSSVARVLSKNGRWQSCCRTVQVDASVQPEFTAHGAVEICPLHSTQSFQGLPTV